MEFKSLSCRTCGNKFSIAQDVDMAQMKPIIAMHEIVEQLTAWNVQVTREDGLPQYICSVCLADFQKVLKLKSRCLETQAKLVHMSSLELYVEPLNKFTMRELAMQRSMDKCRLCPKQFHSNWESRYKFHMEWHKLKMRHKCPMCRFSCRTKENLRAHKRAVHLIIKCSSCDKKIRKDLFYRHLNKHLEDRHPKNAKRLHVLPKPPRNVMTVASTPVAAPSITIGLAPAAAATAMAIPEAPTQSVAAPSSSSEPPAPVAYRQYSPGLAAATLGGSKALQPSNNQESRDSYLWKDKEADRKTQQGQHLKRNTMPRI